jgi:type II secretory pathway component PulC
MIVCHVYLLPQVHATENELKNTHLETENCESCRASHTPKAVEQLIPEICSATMMLIGTALGTKPELSAVIIKDQDRPYRVGSIIPTVGTIKSIGERNRVIVIDENNKERRFPMFCDSQNKDRLSPKVQSPIPSSDIANVPTQNSASRFQSVHIESKDIEQISQNTLGLLKQATATHHVDDDGKHIGIKLTNIQADGLYDKLKLQDGDVLLKVNNSPVHGPATMLNFVRMLKDNNKLELQVLRGEQRIFLGADIAK